MEQRLVNSRQEEGEGVGIHPQTATCLYNLKSSLGSHHLPKFPLEKGLLRGICSKKQKPHYRQARRDIATQDMKADTL